MKPTLILALDARVIDRKLYILGTGWGAIGPEPHQMALGLILELAWDETADSAETAKTHVLELKLLRSDRTPAVKSSGELLVQPFTYSFEAVRPSGALRGEPVVGCVSFDIPAVPLVPDSRYIWQLVIDGQTNPDWDVSFWVCAPCPCG